MSFSIQDASDMIKVCPGNGVKSYSANRPSNGVKPYSALNLSYSGSHPRLLVSVSTDKGAHRSIPNGKPAISKTQRSLENVLAGVHRWKWLFFTLEGMFCNAQITEPLKTGVSGL